jgi:DNA repair exonuclease SbcCD nuclease subunit
MEKITMSTDWHFGKSNGKFDAIILNGVRTQCEHAKKYGITTMINLGDTLDIKETISTSTLNHLAKAFKLLSDTFDNVYILAGNHDMSKKTYDSNGHNLHIFSGYKNIKIVDEPQIVEIYNKNFYMLPYFPNAYIKDHQFPIADYMCGHIEVQGFMLNQFIKAEEGANANTITEKYNHVFLGHFHKKQTKGKLTYIGNICRFFYGEDSDERGWTILDVNTGDREFIEYHHPRMYRFKVSELLEIDDLTTIFSVGDNLKLIIDTNLKYSELEELKSKLLLTHGINDLVLDDQYFVWDDLDSDDEDDTDDESSTKINSDQSYMDFVLNEMIKNNKDLVGAVDRESIKFLRELSKTYQE